MEFGKLENIESIDFTLPDDHTLSENTFKNGGGNFKANIYIGCPVWANKGYVGKVFPKGTQPKNYLKEYCKQFNSIEVNATHYQIPELRTIENWKEAATTGFKFCPKFPQIISHRNDFYEKQEWIDLFLSAVYQLDEHLGISFIQFPPFFKIDKLEKLRLFFARLPRDLSFATELRHESWFESDSIKGEWFSLFHEYNITPVITDTSGRRDVIHQMITNEQVFIRFTGNNLHPTDYQRIDEWCDRIVKWISKGIKEVYFFVHEPEKHLCADIAIYMIHKLNEIGNIKIKPPHIYKEQTGKLF